VIQAVLPFSLRICGTGRLSRLPLQRRSDRPWWSADVWLVQLSGLDKLTELDLRERKVTAKGVQGLAKALPKCKITWEGGVIEPK